LSTLLREQLRGPLAVASVAVKITRTEKLLLREGVATQDSGVLMDDKTEATASAKI